MPRYPIYASDFGQLGNQLQQTEALHQQSIQQAQQNFMRAQERQQQQENYDRQMAYRQAMDQQALARQAMLDKENSRYLDWQMGTNGRYQQEPAAIQTAKFNEDLDYAITHGVARRPELEPYAKAAQPELAQRHQLYSGAADVVNRRDALKLAIQRLKSGIASLPNEVIGQMGGTAMSYPDVAKKTAEVTRNLRTLHDKYTKELENIEPQAEMVLSNKELSSGIQFDPRTRSFRPAYIPAFMDTNAPAGPRTGTNAPAVVRDFSGGNTLGTGVTPGAPRGYAPPQPRMVTVTNRAGNLVQIPIQNLEAAIARGYQPIQ